jgi:hypothetical protein
VTVVALTVGARAFELRSAMSFIVENEITLVGMFSQNGFRTIEAGAPVDIVFNNAPGRIYHAKITGIPKGVGQGQIAVSGTLARTNSLGGATCFPAEISIPEEMTVIRCGWGCREAQRLLPGCRRDRSPRVRSGVGQFLYRLSVNLHRSIWREAGIARAMQPISAAFNVIDRVVSLKLGWGLR